MAKRKKSGRLAAKLRGRTVKGKKVRKGGGRSSGALVRRGKLRRLGKGNKRRIGRKLGRKRTTGNSGAYKRAYQAGFDTAYNEGFDVGYAEGMETGHQDAYKGA